MQCHACAAKRGAERAIDADYRIGIYSHAVKKAEGVTHV